MKKTIIQSVVVVAMSALLLSCSLFGGKPKAEELQPEIAELSSTHECNSSDGEIWSILLERCIRPTELGGGATSLEGDAMAFVVFSADSLQCELFITDQQISHLLDRRSAQSGYVWNVEDDDTYNVNFVDGKMQIRRRANIEFAQ